MKDSTMMLAVLNKSNGKDALDYCCSTSTVKNEFVSFWKATLFFMMAQTSTGRLVSLFG